GPSLQDPPGLRDRRAKLRGWRFRTQCSAMQRRAHRRIDDAGQRDKQIEENAWREVAEFGRKASEGFDAPGRVRMDHAKGKPESPPFGERNRRHVGRAER